MPTSLLKNSFDFIVDEIDALVYAIDIENYEILYTNKKCKEEFGNIVGQKCYKSLQNKNRPCIECPTNNNEKKEVNHSYKWEHTNEFNKKTYLFSDRIIKSHNSNKLIKVQVGIDITTQKNLEKEVEQQQLKTLETFEALFNSTIEALIIYNMDKKCINVNDIAPRLLGYTKEEMIGKDALSFIASESLHVVSEAINNSDQEPYEALMLKKDKTTFPALIRGKNITLNSKTIRISAVIDISKIKEKEKEISKLAFYDCLTLLPNRTLLKRKTENLISYNRRHSDYCSFIFIDLDHFKTINDTKGHLIGDLILIQCAKRLENLLKKGDFIGRFGGDEFIILVNTYKKNKEEAKKEIEKITKKILNTIKETFTVKQNQYQLSASIGIAMFNEDISFHELLKRADTAMYFVKDKGRDDFGFFDPKLQKSLERKAIVLQRLREAINNAKINIHFQKQVNSKEEVIGVEALARWEDEELGFVSPAEFIPIAEESGLIIRFGHCLIEETAKVLQEWQNDKEKKHWRISINVSLSQFQRDDFEYLIKNAILKYKINANLLRLEITESLLLKNADKALEKIDYLKELGLTLSIDDFGTGYSSLAYLKKLPVDELKIDKSFIDDIVTNKSDETIVAAILEIGNQFGFEVIAEGVETKEIYEKLLNLGCKYFQGYYFAKPKKKEDL
ncbi:diguanylate cyclase [Halarcobacter mediterraneus]|uniref:Diguanylate cyclase n=1 Tax=Halarcobacter mediterraneus TaxID=2023153 RepID=A0A4Q1AYJ3_9BACT|nr:GGDEF domain-containing phosphodiesterase [Halarcobacter mediterraneus]RXK14443.1 diguanylate cyclase [Halarcobacter mediterraneus]